MKFLPDVLCLVGVTMVSAGLWLVHPSAMLCIVGAGLVAGGVFVSRAKNRGESR